MELILEVGLKLNNTISYYHDMLVKQGFTLDFSVITHDIYYTKESLDGLTEKQMKNKCKRLRCCNVVNKIADSELTILEEEQKLLKVGYKKVFDTIKFDFQYSRNDIKSKIQIQDIKDIGLLVYYDNPDYYKYKEDEQRKLLIKELNTYGFNFKEDELGIDKLRTLYYGKEMYSKNQNG